MDEGKLLNTVHVAPQAIGDAQQILNEMHSTMERLRDEQLRAAISILEKISLEGNVSIPEHDRNVQWLVDGKAVLALPSWMWIKLDDVQQELLRSNHYLLLLNSTLIRYPVLMERPKQGRISYGHTTIKEEGR